MKIEAIGENKIIVDLNRDDMTSLDITYDDMDYSNIETRRVIWTLLDRAKQALGRDIDPSGKMLIEAVPKNEGGCILYFTVASEVKSLRSIGKAKIRKEMLCFVCEFSSIDDLFNCADTLSKSDFLFLSSLYEKNGLYRLIVSSDSPLERLKNIFSEFSSICGESGICASLVKEHWNLIEKDTAMLHLSSI